jgi:hypothetical protein
VLTSAAVANNFWGKDDAGVNPLLDRMAAAKQTCDELRAFYNGKWNGFCFWRHHC